MHQELQSERDDTWSADRQGSPGGRDAGYQLNANIDLVGKIWAALNWTKATAKWQLVDKDPAAMKALKEQFEKYVATKGWKELVGFDLDSLLSQMRDFEGQLRSHAKDVGLHIWVNVCCEVDGKERCRWMEVANGIDPQGIDRSGAYFPDRLSPRDVKDAIETCDRRFRSADCERR